MTATHEILCFVISLILIDLGAFPGSNSKGVPDFMNTCTIHILAQLCHQNTLEHIICGGISQIVRGEIWETWVLCQFFRSFILADFFSFFFLLLFWSWSYSWRWFWACSVAMWMMKYKTVQTKMYYYLVYLFIDNNAFK